MQTCHTRVVFRCSSLSIFLIIAFLCEPILFAQKIESVYINEFESGKTIYTITNRTYTFDETKYQFLNEVTQDSALTYLKITFYQPDSLNIRIIAPETFLHEITEKKEDWLLFIHGDSKTFEQAVMRGYDIQHLHKINVIVYSWPTKDPNYNGIKNFKNSKMNVLKSLDHFERLLTFIEEFRQSNAAFSNDKKLSLFIHSLGNSYLENLVKENRNNAYQDFIFENVVLNAAAVNQEGHDKWVEGLSFQENIYITSNRRDFNLKGVRIFTKDGKQLGEKVLAPIAQNADYIQFTEAVGFRTPTGTTHTYFIGEVADESHTIKQFYTELFHGNKIDLNDKKRFIKRQDGVGYDIIF
jgi:esterase/lipase superfamily enzyme